MYSSNSKWLLVGYYTVDTPYEQEVEKLKLTLDVFKIPYDFMPVENRGKWQKNTQMKAEVILVMLDKYPNRPLVYLDVDALIIHYPVVFDTLKCDIAAVHYCRSTELLSGTIYFGNTPKTRTIVKRWIEINKKYPDRLPDNREAWDQRTLEMAIKKTKCNFVELPQEYTFVTELTQRTRPDLSPVILHTRGGWRFQRIIDRKPFVWAVFPTANFENAKKCVAKWEDRGYKTAVLSDGKNKNPEIIGADRHFYIPEWQGFAKAVNFLCREINSEIIVVAGDDIYPDTRMRADAIAQQFKEHFPDLNGVMQPTGDRYGCIDQCAISPWIGRGFIEKMAGKPYYESYFHYFADEDLQNVATKQGVFWQRRDISQYHDHWQRHAGEQRPKYLMKALDCWADDKRIFAHRKLIGFIK